MVSRRLRFEVLRRDAHTCRYCGATAPDVKLTVDHVVPTTLGGSDEPSNLVASCAGCNAGKSSMAPDAPLVDEVAEDALRWASAMERAAAIQAARFEERDEYVAVFSLRWSDWKVGGELVPRPTDWSRSVGRFFEMNLPMHVMTDTIRQVLDNPRVKNDGAFAYFCGVCWGILRERQELAYELLAAEA